MDISIHAPPRGATWCSSPLCIAEKNFNSRPSARGDATSSTATHGGAYFNSRPSARGDRDAERAHTRNQQFQFTPLREGRRQLQTSRRSGAAISIHAPPRGATRHCNRLRPAGHFNSRPSARGDRPPAGRPASRGAISIHAPPRGATAGNGWKILFDAISIHAPPRGATSAAIAQRFATSYFNSRPSARGDTEIIRNLDMVCISIHAPPRGATPKRREIILGGKFQFTPLREGRPESFAAEARKYISIHAPPRGATRVAVVLLRRRNISIHAPPRGATGHQHAGRHHQAISIHAPPRGATAVLRGECAETEMISIHAPPRGATAGVEKNRKGALFQFTPLREGRQLRHIAAENALFISIHAPPRGATGAQGT